MQCDAAINKNIEFTVALEIRGLRVESRTPRPREIHNRVLHKIQTFFLPKLVYSLDFRYLFPWFLGTRDGVYY